MLGTRCYWCILCITPFITLCINFFIYLLLYTITTLQYSHGNFKYLSTYLSTYLPIYCDTSRLSGLGCAIDFKNKFFKLKTFNLALTLTTYKAILLQLLAKIKTQIVPQKQHKEKGKNTLTERFTKGCSSGLKQNLLSHWAVFLCAC